jgi:AGZA family xanthine/uracil permease-like MFS transporter
MLWAATMALVIERKFVHAAAWLGAASLLSAFGVIHSFALTPTGIEGHIGWGAARPFGLGYLAGAIFLVLCGWYTRSSRYRESCESTK